MGDVQRSAGRLEPYEDRPWVPPASPTRSSASRASRRSPPDGTKIAYTSAYGRLRKINGDTWIDVGAIAVMDADGSGATPAHAASQTDLVRAHATVLVAGRQADRLRSA